MKSNNLSLAAGLLLLLITAKCGIEARPASSTQYITGLPAEPSAQPAATAQTQAAGSDARTWLSGQSHRPMIFISNRVEQKDLRDYKIVQQPGGVPCLTISWKTSPDGSGPGYPKIYFANGQMNSNVNSNNSTNNNNNTNNNNDNNSAKSN